ncbi:IS30 family transposase [Mycoplasmopsis anatis]
MNYTQLKPEERLIIQIHYGIKTLKEILIFMDVTMHHMHIKKWELDNVIQEITMHIQTKHLTISLLKITKKNYHGVEATLKLYQEKTNKKRLFCKNYL